MNEITPFERKQRNIRVIIAIVILAIGSFITCRLVLADNQQADKTISQMNEQLTVIENKLMVNSQIYNDLDSSNAQLKFQMTGNQAMMEFYNTGNTQLRSEKAKLIADKEALLLWK